MSSPACRRAAPSARRLASFSGRSTAVTSAPANFASWSAIAAMLPPAPMKVPGFQAAQRNGGGL